MARRGRVVRFVEQISLCHTLYLVSQPTLKLPEYNQ